MKLYYFDRYARAEAIRMMLTKAGMEFEDNRVSKEDWAEMKGNTQFGSMPYLVLDDGTTIYQA